MKTFPHVKVTEIKPDEVLGLEHKHAKLPCVFCMSKGEFDRHKEACRGVFIVEIADLVKLPLCRMHADDFVGDKR